MSSQDKLKVNLVTPQGPIAQTTTDAVIAPGRLGEFEVLAGHIPFLSELHTGVLRIGEKNDVSYYAVGQGFLEVEPSGEVQVLCEQALAAESIDKDAAQELLSETAPKLRDWKGSLDAEYRSLKSKNDWAQAQLDTLEKIAN
jgi:F-type H+-transporting ATPase subunit epsilon